MLYPQKGRRVRDTWDSPYHNAWTKFKAKGRFLQLCSVLHFENILKHTLGKYAEHGSELSLDKATMANKSSYGRFLICFNPTKPTRKFHFKVYMVCCTESNLKLQIKIHMKGNSDDADHELNDKLITKLDK